MIPNQSRKRFNHPFLDGNKRTGFMLAATFIELNGMDFAATEESLVEMTLALAGGKVKQAGYAKWLSDSSSPTSSSRQREGKT